jgi:molybdopterin molybdotransferase
MMTVDEAQALVFAEVSPLPAEIVPLEEADGRVLREDVVAPRDVPQLDNSAMDGYAVRAADTPGALRVVGDVPAGKISQVAVEAGTAIRIMTGAAVPEGADAVAQFEITDRHTDVVTIKSAVAAGSNIRRAGEDMRASDLILRIGTLLGAGEIGVLATAQKSAVSVGRRPSVAILATGDELIEVGDAPAPGMSVNSNSYALAVLVRQAGGVPHMRGIVRDDRAATMKAIESALDCDFIVSSGGVSVGAYDFVKDALDALGAETKFWRVAMKPGKPVVLSRLRDRLYFGLPGNPVSALVSFTLFVAPSIRKAQGQTTNILPPVVNLRTTAPLKSGGDRRAYLRVRVTARDGELVAEPMKAQGSGVSTSMVQANGFAILEIGTTRVDAGQTVPVMLLSFRA